MLSVARFKGEMRRQRAAYTGPNPDVRAHIAQADVAILMGPSGIGKNEQKSRLIHAVSGRLAIAEAASVTSRPRRSEEQGPQGFDPYLKHFNIRSQRGQNQIMDMFDGGLFVQASIHPHTGHLYATTQEAYAASTIDRRVVTLADFMAREYIELAGQDLFQSLSGIYLAAQDNEQYVRMWSNRGGSLGTAKEVDCRLAEGEESLGLCLNAEGAAADNLSFVVHDYSDALMPGTGLTRTTGTILSIVSQEGGFDNSEGWNAAQSMHSFIQGMRQGIRISAELAGS